ncbi:MAG: glycosyltransferase [Acetobacter sp.]|nr:glycosyltransferase [Acetobacter sp.]
MMKKVIAILFLLAVAGAYWFFALRLDYSKIVFVLPSSERTSSPYYYGKDGDFFLAADLKQGFEKLGYKVEYRFREDYDNLKLGNAGNVLYFKGYYNFEHLPAAKDDGRKRVLYIYYVEGLNSEILDEVDVVASASKRFANEVISAQGIAAIYVPQFTNPERFKLAEVETDKTYPVLFVGSNHSGYGREVVDFALLVKTQLSVFGKFWEKNLTPETLKGQYIDNDELYRYYANAGVVLNDHRADMRFYGFVSNRIYDVTASGGFVLTDYLPEIEEIYGDSVATYKDFYEFKAKLDYYLAHPEERKIMAEKAREITLKQFTNQKAAAILDSVFKNIKK